MLNFVPSQFQAIRSFLQARLSRRIVIWVFASILLIEAIILLPSIYRRQQELLSQLKELSAVRVAGGLAAAPSTSDSDLLRKINRLTAGSAVRGGTLYRNSGELVGHFGEQPALSFQQAQQGEDRQYAAAAARYDAVWQIDPLLGQYVLIVRHDATSVQQELIAFIGRISILVTIISIFVTLATLVGIERTLITPILSLRNDLLKVGKTIRQDQIRPEFSSLKFRRSDELGEVIAAFDQMYQQVSEAIAEQRQAEAALQKSEEKFSKAFQSSPSAILISTLAEGRLIEVNDSFLQLYGSTLADVIGKRVVDLKLWATAADRTDMIQQLRQTGALRNLEYTFHTKAGEPRAILFSAELISLNGEDCLVSVANDITERKQAEKALQRLAEIGELAAMIVHEVRNPLTTVMMGLRSFAAMELADRARVRLNLALEEAERLQRLLNEILQYARCQKLQQMSEIELNDLSYELIEAIRVLPLAQGRQIEFLPTHAVYVLGDRDKLKQVLINLISNAYEAVAIGETITWQLDVHQNQQIVQIHVFNPGQPIPLHVLDRLTQPFVTTKSSGNGLGLAIVRRIVEAHQGELTILSSEAIQGTKVTVSLPMATPAKF